MHPDLPHKCEGCGTVYAEYINGCPRCWDDTLSREENLLKYPNRKVVPNYPTPAKWEERFEEEIGIPDHLPYLDAEEYVKTAKSFIHQLLSDYKSRLLSEVEGMKSKHDENCAEDEAMCNEMDDLMESRNQGISAAVEVVKKMK